MASAAATVPDASVLGVVVVVEVEVVGSELVVADRVAALAGAPKAPVVRALEEVPPQAAKIRPEAAKNTRANQLSDVRILAPFHFLERSDDRNSPSVKVRPILEIDGSWS